LDGFRTAESLQGTLKPNDTKFYAFGLGGWKRDHFMDSLVSRVEHVEITTLKRTEVYKGNRQINAFFEDRLTDVKWKALILIELK